MVMPVIIRLLKELPFFCLVSVPVTVLFYFMHEKVLCRNKKPAEYVWFAFFIVYIQVLYEVFIGISGGLTFHSMRHKPNLIPLVGLIQVYDMGFDKMMAQILLNVVLMIPFGFLLPAAFLRFRSFFRTIAMALGVSVCVEVLQYFIGRSADIDDVIMNTAGAVCGYLCFRIFAEIGRNRKRET